MKSFCSWNIYLFFINLFPIIYIIAEKRISYNHQLKYKSICNSKGRNGSSLCNESDDDRLSEIIKGQSLDGPNNAYYNFTKNPPDLDGQIGVPMIIDTILGDFNIDTHTSN